MIENTLTRMRLQLAMIAFSSEAGKVSKKDVEEMGPMLEAT